jgi:hypothetical protein
MTTLRATPFALAAALLFTLVGCDKGPSATPEQVRAKAQECADAMLGGDYGKVADLTHPKIVNEIGGRSKMVETMTTAVAQMKAQRFSLKSYTAKAPGEILGSGSDRMAVVPTAMEMQTPTGTLKQNSYLLGISSDGGRNWTFVDGSEMTADRLKFVVPNPPKDLKLPARQAPVME